MRLEKIVARALEQVGNDRYLLAKATGIRAKEISTGSTPLVDMDAKKYMATDIALHEIADGKLKVTLEN